MNLLLKLILAGCIGAILGFIASKFWPFTSAKTKTDTAFFFRRSRSRIWIYGPTVLYALLYVGAAVWGMKVLIYKDWKTVLDTGKNLSEIDYKIADAILIWTAFSNSLSFCSKKVAEIDDRKKKVVEEETKSGLISTDPNLR